MKFLSFFLLAVKINLFFSSLTKILITLLKSSIYFNQKMAENNILLCFVLNKNFYINYSKNCYMFVWTSGFQNPLVHTDFNMFVDE